MAGVSALPYWMLRMLGCKKLAGLICSRLVLVSTCLKDLCRSEGRHAGSHA